MAFPGRIVDDVIPVSGHLGAPGLAQPFKSTGGDLVQGFPHVGGNTGGRNGRSCAGQDIRRLLPTAGKSHIEFFVRPGQCSIFFVRPFLQGIAVPDPVLGPAVSQGYFVIGGSVESVGILTVVIAFYSTGIHGHQKRHILVLGGGCHRSFPGCFRREHMASQGQQAHTQGSCRQVGRRTQMAGFFLSSPFSQLRHHHIAVPDPAPDDFVDFVHNHILPKDSSFCRKKSTLLLYF